MVDTGGVKTLYPRPNLMPNMTINVLVNAYCSWDCQLGLTVLLICGYNKKFIGTRVTFRANLPLIRKPL